MGCFFGACGTGPRATKSFRSGTDFESLQSNAFGKMVATCAENVRTFGNASETRRSLTLATPQQPCGAPTRNSEGGCQHMKNKDWQMEKADNTQFDNTTKTSFLVNLLDLGLFKRRAIVILIYLFSDTILPPKINILKRFSGSHIMILISPGCLVDTNPYGDTN